VSLELGTAKLRSGSELHVQYRIGPPLAGNIDVGTLIAIPPGQDVDDLDRITGVKNIMPGTGGREPESLDAARLAIPDSLRKGDLQRAVTLEDYALLAENSDPRVARAVAKEIGEPFNTVLVLVDPKDDAVLDDELKRTLELALDRGRMVGREVLVRPADNVPLDVEIVVCALENFKKDDVKQAVLDALRPGDPERPGFFHPNRLNFGDDVELGDLIAETQRVPGVLGLKVTKFKRLLGLGPEILQRIGLGTTEVARLDADETHPENGKLVVKVGGLDPLPDDVLEVAQSDDLRLGGAA
jgi:predicted phage baseplate assembly protein